MSIYDYETFEIQNLLDVIKLKKKYPKKKLNFLHRYNSVVWQGPLYIKILSEKLNSKNCNYIVEIGENIALTLLLISFKIKILAIDKKILKNQVEKILSILDYQNSNHFSEKEKNLLDLAFASGKVPNQAKKEHFDKLNKHYTQSQITIILFWMKLEKQK